MLLFGVGEERQGIYSLRSIDDDELPVHTVVAFASADDAFRYAVSCLCFRLSMLCANCLFPQTDG